MGAGCICAQVPLCPVLGRLRGLETKMRVGAALVYHKIINTASYIYSPMQVQIMYIIIVPQTNKYQGLVVTDTVYSYYAFSYACGDIEWSGQGFETAVVGYNSRGDYYKNHPANGLPDIGRIVSCTRQVVSAGRRRKRQAQGTLPADELPAGEELVAAVEMCNGFSRFDGFSIPDIGETKGENSVSILELVPKCPPTRLHMDISTEFVEFPAQVGDCFRSINSYAANNPNLLKPYEFVSICCYNING